MVEELFAYIFGVYIKFGYKNPLTLTLSDSVDVATCKIDWVTSAQPIEKSSTSPFSEINQIPIPFHLKAEWNTNVNR